MLEAEDEDEDAIMGDNPDVSSMLSVDGIYRTMPAEKAAM